jgi:hypothetical protein
MSWPNVGGNSTISKPGAGIREIHAFGNWFFDAA